MRAAFVLAALLLLGTAAIAVVPEPVAATSQCTVQGHLDPDTRDSCIQRDLQLCHYAYPHPCA